MKKALMIISAIVGIAGCVLAGVAPAVYAKTIELKFSTGFSPKHTMQTKVFEPWAEKINQMSNGQVKVTFFPGGALGKTPDQYDLVEKGIADICYTLHDYTPGRFPMTTVFELPFIIKSATGTSEAMWRVYEQFPEFRREYRKVKVLGLFCHPAGNFNSVDKPIKTLEDLKGMKFRTASPHVTDALKLFGAVPVNMPITETYTALERGVVKGTVLPWEGNFVFKLAEILKYGTETDFYTMTMMVVMNQRKYDKLPEDVKKIIDETTGMAMSSEAGKVYDQTNEPMRQLCQKKGMQSLQLPLEEKNKLEKITMPLRQKWVKDMEAKGLPGQAVLDAAIKYIK
ncbi:MAG: TRAP transporter substrate-binding protein [Desulfobacteraceae bacterium]